MQEPPLLNPCGLVDYTTGGELRPALKCIYSHYTALAARCQIKRGRKVDSFSISIPCGKILASFSRILYNRDMEYISKSAAETLDIAAAFASKLVGGDVVLLHGDLGAGKTTFTKGIARALGVKDVVTSPTFTIVKEYEGERLALFHMDMYRLSGDVTELGLEEYFKRKDGVTVIEWCALSDLPSRVYNVYLSYAGDDRRIVIEE